MRKRHKTRAAKTQIPGYAERDRLLRQMGFRSYQHYLGSSLWAEIRERVLRRDGRRCRICSVIATQVHHQRYDYATLRGKNPDNLMSLCHACHETVEFDDHDRKRSPAAARKHANRLRNPQWLETQRRIKEVDEAWERYVEGWRPH